MKTLDMNYARCEKNDCDTTEVLLCIQAWHEMLHPGHHKLCLFSDGSGYVEAAHNYPPFITECYSSGRMKTMKLLSFSSLQDFIDKTMKELDKKGWKVIDSKQGEIKASLGV